MILFMIIQGYYIILADICIISSNHDHEYEYYIINNHTNNHDHEYYWYCIYLVVY